MVQEISHVNSQNKYIIPNHQNSKGKRELNMQVDIKMKNSKKLKVKTLVVLQSQDLRVGQVKESCIRVNIRELNKELCIRLSTLYTNI